MHDVLSKFLTEAAGVDVNGHTLRDASGSPRIEPSLRTGDRKGGAQPPPGVLILPNANYNFCKSSRRIFEVIAPKHRLFSRGRVVVEIVEAEQGMAVGIVTPARFRSLLDEFGPVMAYLRGDGELVLVDRRCSEDNAKALLQTTDAFSQLPPLALITRCPVAIELNGKFEVLGSGYHRVNGGLLVTGHAAPVDVPLDLAVSTLLEAVVDFDFVAPGDRSRALASFITPALRMGGWLHGPTPVDVAEADDSQSGKTYRQKLVRATYGESAYAVSKREGGVGSLDESLSAALLSGRPFIALDNLRGLVDSQFLEMLITWDEPVPVRVPYRGEVAVDCTRVSLQMTSNGVETTRDLANRSSIIRIRKHPKNYQFRKFPEGDLLEHIKANQAFWLGCVFTIVKAWHAAGKPSTGCTDHDFRAWAGPLDWIVQDLFKAAPLVDGHVAAQLRVSNPALSWLRNVALAVVSSKRLGEELTATGIYDICDECGVEIPGLRAPDEQRGPRLIGMLLGRCFRETNIVEIDRVSVSKTVKRTYQPHLGNSKDLKSYTFNLISAAAPCAP